MPRFALLLVLLAFLAGCGGDEAPSAGSGGDPATALPADVPVAVKVDTDIDSDQWEATLAFAERLDPGDADLAAALREELGGEGVSFEEDVEPWIGDEIAVGFAGVDVGEELGVVVVPTSDEEATRETLAKGDTEGRDATYEGVEYRIDEDGEASGVVDGFLIGASDVDRFEAAVDALRGESLADTDQYRDAVADAAEDRLVMVYADQDGLLEIVEPLLPGTTDSAKSTPGYEPGQTYVGTLAAEDERMTLELSGPGTELTGDAPAIADLPAGAWLAAAGALPEGFGTEFARSFEQSFELAAGDAAPILEESGALPFLEGLQSMALRIGGTTVQSLNGEVALTGSDPAAARRLFDRAVTALRQEDAPVQVDGDTATLTVPPFTARLTVDGGGLRLEAGERPDGQLGDDDAFGEAVDAVGFDDLNLFVDFAPLEELVRTLPPDPSFDEVMPVLGELGTLAAGSETGDDGARARVVLSLR